MDVSRRDILIGGSGLFGGVALSLVFEEVTRTSEAESVSIDVVSRNRPTDADTPVKMFYWNDYQCPFCYRFESETLPDLRTQFIDPGDVEFVLKPISVFGQDSLSAALGAHCVLDQTNSTESFLRWHNMMYETYQSGNDRNNGWASPLSQAEYVNGFDSVVGDELTSCIQDREYSARVENDRAEAAEFGLEGTPFFVFYNSETGETTTVTGAQPLPIFEDTINSIQSSE